MSLIRTQRVRKTEDPLESLLRLQGRFLRSFDLPARADTALRTSADESGYEIRLEIPGTAPDDVVVETRDGLLEISIKGGDQNEVAWSRSIRVPNDSDLGAIDAQYLHGVLTVSIPKKEEAQPRQIEIRSA
jgi:HSP20 family molecular chaperone IbpA